MAQYMLLINIPSGGSPSPEEGGPSSEDWFRYSQELDDAGARVAGDALELVESATTVRVRDGETLITDGPFAETKEVLGGYFIVDVPDLDAALKWAAKMPNITYGSVEVRPVMVYDQQPASA
jgi:hypothetical protein